MPRVLLDVSVLGSQSRGRGIGRYVADLGRALARAAGPDCDLELLGVERLPWLRPAVVTRELAGAIDRLTHAGAPCEGHMAWAYRLRLGMAAAARAAGADLLHCGHPDATPLGRTGCPRLTTCHDLIPLRWPREYLTWKDGYRIGQRLLDRRRYLWADHIIAVSEATAADLVARLAVPARRISVVPNGLDLTQWPSQPQPGDDAVCAGHGLEPQRFLLCVGSADWRKNCIGVLHALAVCRRRQPALDLRLAWAGETRPALLGRLRLGARALGVAPAVQLLGEMTREHLGALYRTAAATLVVSWQEGFGYPVLEAMASGCPVVASNCSSLPEVAGDAAILVDPDCPEAIAAAALCPVESPAERLRLAEAGLARARRFSAERCAQETLAVYRQVLRGAAA
ncbi:MAG: glycosyltransferase family 4 protein [Deltaproteobacteria bacterium]|nr:glycosyltransferase family 4 protein [Deltaproteobacteria bacterium]